MICFEIYFLQIIYMYVFLFQIHTDALVRSRRRTKVWLTIIFYITVLNYLTFGYFEEIEEQISVSGSELTQNVFGNEFFLPRVKDSLPRLNWKSRDSARTIFPQFCREDITGKIVLDEIE